MLYFYYVRLEIKLILFYIFLLLHGDFTFATSLFFTLAIELLIDSDGHSIIPVSLVDLLGVDALYSSYYFH